MWIAVLTNSTIIHEYTSCSENTIVFKRFSSLGFPKHSPIHYRLALTATLFLSSKWTPWRHSLDWAAWPGLTSSNGPCVFNSFCYIQSLRVPYLIQNPSHTTTPLPANLGSTSPPSTPPITPSLLPPPNSPNPNPELQTHSTFPSVLPAHRTFPITPRRFTSFHHRQPPHRPPVSNTQRASSPPSELYPAARWPVVERHGWGVWGETGAWAQTQTSGWRRRFLFCTKASHANILRICGNERAFLQTVRGSHGSHEGSSPVWNAQFRRSVCLSLRARAKIRKDNLFLISPVFKLGLQDTRWICRLDQRVLASPNLNFILM